jgi:heme A synthase
MPDNASFMHAAYAVAVTAYTLYGLSLWRRRRAVRRELERSATRSESAR